MTLFEKTIRAFENQDFDLLKSIHHEDFMFVREFSMSSREEHLAKLKERLPTSTLHKRVQCVHEDDNVLVMRKSDIDDNGIAYFTSNVSIKHEGLYWRTMVKKDEQPHADHTHSFTDDTRDTGGGDSHEEWFRG